MTSSNSNYLDGIDVVVVNGRTGKKLGVVSVESMAVFEKIFAYINEKIEKGGNYINE